MRVKEKIRQFILHLGFVTVEEFNTLNNSVEFFVSQYDKEIKRLNEKLSALETRPNEQVSAPAGDFRPIYPQHRTWTSIRQTLEKKDHEAALNRARGLVQTVTGDWVQPGA